MKKKKNGILYWDKKKKTLIFQKLMYQIELCYEIEKFSINEIKISK